VTALIPLEGATTTALTLPVEMGYEEWRSTLLAVARIGKASQWWIGDALLHGENRFGEQFAQAASETGYSEESLRGFLWVASRIPPSVRRPTLSWSHHQVVAGCGDTEEAKDWLEIAERSTMSVRELREAIRGPAKPKAVCGMAGCPMREEAA
jgi:hypothetical protein